MSIQQVTDRQAVAHIRQRWPSDVIAKVKRLWEAGYPGPEIAARIVADGLLITSRQVCNIVSHYRMRGPRSKPLHSAEFIAQVRFFWENGWSAGLIAATIKTLTRNAVIGLAHRHRFKRKTVKHITLSGEM
jgi:hypothetical protein